MPTIRKRLSVEDWLQTSTGTPTRIAPEAKAQSQRHSAKSPAYASRFKRSGEEGELMRFLYPSPHESKEYTLWVQGTAAISCDCWPSRKSPSPCKHQVELTFLVGSIYKVQEEWRDNLDLLDDAWD